MLSIFILIVSILFFGIGVYLFSHTHKINKQVDSENKQLQEQNNLLKQNYVLLEQETEKAKNNLNEIHEVALRTADTQKELSQKAFENYCEVLENQYKEVEEEYDMYKDALETSYSNRQLELLYELDEVQKDLDKVKATRAAALQAQLKENEIKENLAFYCLTISQTNLDDIKTLEKIKSQLHNPRILSMLIWQTYYQKPMTSLCNNILGTDTICGIYKITNQLDNMCYIGQSVDISKRWKDHAKCGLGIDTPIGNKLYKAMQEVGLYNFSFELLEECPRDQLNEKEKYYIGLYQSNEFGYNSTIGNN